MKKKVLAIILVVILAVSSVFATKVAVGVVDTNKKYNSTKMENEKLGVGATIGYGGLGLALNYTKNDLDKIFGFRWYLDLGFGWWNTSFSANTGFDWVWLKLVFTDTGSKEAENSILDFSIGAGAHLDVVGNGGVGIGPVGVFTITYNFAKDWQVFSRTSVGYGWWFNNQGAQNGIIWDERLGFTYQFDLAKN